MSMLVFPELSPQFLTQMPKQGLVLEFGVSSGGSIRAIANAIKPRQVYGFDWFKGLPEDWVLKNGRVHEPKGAFAAEVPVVPENAILVHGLIQDTFDDFLDDHAEPIAFAHFDFDLYSSTKHVLDRISNRLMNGTIFVFDEYEGMVAHDEHEARAFIEFLDQIPYRAVRVAYLRGDAAAFMLLRL